MPDITMCSGKECPLKETCYRHTAAPDRYQSYFVNPPIDKATKKCDYYWKEASDDKSNLPNT